MHELSTQVAIMGAGPAGLLLSRLLTQRGISNVLIERQPMEYVLSRIRAGVLEQGTVGKLTEAGVGDRLAKECYPHEGLQLSYGDRFLRLDLNDLVQSQVTVYGQTEITKDLYTAVQHDGTVILEGVTDASLTGLTGHSPQISGTHNGEAFVVNADLLPGVTVFMGSAAKVSRRIDVKNLRKSIHLVGWAFCQKPHRWNTRWSIRARTMALVCVRCARPT